MLWTHPDLSPEQVYARRIAARELARYWQEFALWSKTKRGGIAPDPGSTRQAALPPPLIEKPRPPEPDKAAGR